MKKVVITENQMKTLIDRISVKNKLNEAADDTYSRDVVVDFYFNNNLLYKGKEINDISRSHITLKYNIQIDARQWGIKDISLYNITGPEEIETQIEYYINEDDIEFENIKFKVDWDKLDPNYRDNSGVISINNELQVHLSSDENGNLVVGSMDIDVYTL